MKEADLYPPVKAYLQRQGYAVKGEVGAADVVARRGDEPPLIVELKLGFSLKLFHQGVERMAVSDRVYLAVARPASDKALRANVALARAAGLGVLSVRLPQGTVEAMCDPGDAGPRRSKKKQERLLKAYDRMRGDPNAGGATRHGIVTGYRQDAVACAQFLAVHGPNKGAVVAKWAEVKTATAIMRNNHYGWFERVSTGVYGLTKAGRKGLEDWGEG